MSLYDYICLRLELRMSVGLQSCMVLRFFPIVSRASGRTAGGPRSESAPPLAAAEECARRGYHRPHRIMRTLPLTHSLLSHSEGMREQENRGTSERRRTTPMIFYPPCVMPARLHMRWNPRGGGAEANRAPLRSRILYRRTHRGIFSWHADKTGQLGHPRRTESRITD